MTITFEDGKDDKSIDKGVYFEEVSVEFSFEIHVFFSKNQFVVLVCHMNFMGEWYGALKRESKLILTRNLNLDLQ